MYSKINFWWRFGNLIKDFIWMESKWLYNVFGRILKYLVFFSNRYLEIFYKLIGVVKKGKYNIRERYMFLIKNRGINLGFFK